MLPIWRARRLVKRIAIFISATFATLGVVVAAALFWMTSDEGARHISNELKKKVRSHTGVDIAFERIEIDLFPPRIRVQGIEGNDRTKRIVCTVDEAELAPSIIALVSRELAIEEVYLGAPNCTVTLQSSDVDKLAGSNQKKKKTSDFSVSSLPEFEVFAISGAALKLKIDDPGRVGKLDAELTGLGVDVTKDDDAIELRFLLEHITGFWQDKDRQAAESLRALTLRASVKDSGIDVRHLSLKTSDGSLSLQDAYVPLPLWPKGPSIDAISVSTPLAILNRLPLDLPRFKGAISYRGQVAVERDSEQRIGFKAKGHFELEDGGIDDFVIGNLDAIIDATPERIRFEDTVLEAATGRLNAAGNIALDDELTVELDLKLEEMELAHILEQATVSGSYVTQTMSGPIRLKGTLNPLKLEGPVQISVSDHTTRTGSFRAKNPSIAIYVPKGLVTGEILITDEILDTKNLKVRSGNSEVTVDMMFNFPGFFWRFHARSDDLYLEDVNKILGFEVGGHGPIDCKIEGPINEPHIKGFGSFKDADIEGMTFDQVTTSIFFENMSLWFEDLEAQKNSSRVSAGELLFDFSAKGGLKIHTKIDAERATVEDLMAVFNIDRKPYGNPTGLLFGQVALAYNLEPEYLQVNADVVHDKLTVFGETFGADVLKLDWNNGELVVNELGLTKGKGTISVTGSIDSEQRMNFIGVGSGINFDGINFDPVRKLELDGALQAFVVIDGTVDHPTGSIDLNVGNVIRRGTRYGPSGLKLKIDDTKVSGTGNIAGKKMNIEYLSFDIAKERFELEAFVDNLNLLPLADIRKSEKEASLTITGDLALKGRVKDKVRIGGHAELMNVNAKYNDVSFENRDPLKVFVRSNRVEISRTRFFGPDIVFDLSGKVSPEKLSIKLKGLADLTSAASLVDGIASTEGRLDFEVRASGDPEKPTFRGEASLTDGYLRLGSFPMEIEKIEGDITLSPKIVRFLDFNARAVGGTLGMNGEMSLDGTDISGYVFKLTADGLSMEPIENVSLKTSTTNDGLILTSPLEGGLPKVTGDLEIRNLQYTEDIRLFDLKDLNVDQLSGTRTTARRPKLLDPKGDFFTFDVRLHGNKNIEAHNNLFDAKLSIDDREKPLRFVGTNQNFGFLGRALGKEGQVRFAGRRFDVKYAAIEFQDQDRPENPYFQVISVGTIRDWKVTMTAEGTVDEYELKFASQPYLPKEDIAFLVLTGLTQAENRQFNASALKLGMPFLGQFGPGGGQLPVELQVYSEYSESAGKDTTRIAMGRWLTDDVWVSISSAVGQTREVGAEVDYRISDEFSLSADYEDEDEGSTGNVGLDLKFRLEF